MALLDETRKANNNVSRYDELTRKIGAIESQVVAWMAEATQLHTDVDTGDKSKILQLRADLITRLQTAVAI